MEIYDPGRSLCRPSHLVHLVRLVHLVCLGDLVGLVGLVVLVFFVSSTLKVIVSPSYVTVTFLLAGIFILTTRWLGDA